MWWWIGGGVVALVLLAGFLVLMFVVAPRLVLRTVRPRLQRRVSAVHPSGVLLQDLGALGLGLQSKGVRQWRGNGALVLTATELHWLQLVTKTELRVPRTAITAVTTVRSHLGKSVNRDLLHVAFTVDGRDDAMAWYVDDLPAWLDALDATR